MQEQVTKLQTTVTELKARIFDMSEEIQRRDTFNAELFSHLAQVLGLEGEAAGQFESYVEKIEELKANQVEVVSE